MLECNIIDRPYFNGHIVLTKAKIGRDLWVLCEYDPGTPFNRKFYFNQGSTDSSVGRSSDLIARSAQLGERRTLDRKVAGSILDRGAVLCP